ncbi:MAG: thermonuclease family protein [Hyphomicrobiales bacterium]|nr:thermonuclease family protein [Hyphomicrobiales bacterium]MBV8825625.1 thermonuclease family protein [Hyphomicrobiales bacterium]MBV9427390.1 thermonuclease family protein [Bradyrhizobiaceae bacterium]
MGKGFLVGTLAVALSAAAAAQAHAQTAGKKPAPAKPIASAECKLTTVASGTVASVVDGRTLVLDDGREVRLAAIEVAAENEPGGVDAKAAFEALTAGRRIELRAGADKREIDRYGRLFGQVYVTNDNGERWVEAELIAGGHARVAARVDERACANALLARERAARAANLGLWSDPVYVIRPADDAAAVAAERGRFAIVEGKVLSVRESGPVIYVNFGRRWTQDFTVTIAKRNESAFTSAGLEPKRLQGRRVRVRGYVEQRGGPWVEATRPEQIELAERN